MTRVAAIRNAGGKSTLSRKVNQVLGLELCGVDQFQWHPGWVLVPEAEVRRQLNAVLARDHWIIHGWGPHDTIIARRSAADTIILVDNPLVIHYWCAFKRQVQCLFRPWEDGLEGCSMLPMTWPLLKLIWSIHHQARPELLTLIDTYWDERQVFHLRSPRALRQFITTYCVRDAP